MFEKEQFWGFASKNPDFRTAWRILIIQPSIRLNKFMLDNPPPPFTLMSVQAVLCLMRIKIILYFLAEMYRVKDTGDIGLFLSYFPLVCSSNAWAVSALEALWLHRWPRGHNPFVGYMDVSTEVYIMLTLMDSSRPSHTSITLTQGCKTWCRRFRVSPAFRRESEICVRSQTCRLCFFFINTSLLTTNLTFTWCNHRFPTHYSHHSCHVRMLRKHIFIIDLIEAGRSPDI